MLVEKKYQFHIIAQLKATFEDLIFGVVFENNKGIPLYDINNYISDGKVMRGKKGEVIEAIFEIELPRIMRGSYVFSAAVAQGRQEQHIMLTWLHGVGELEVVNPGYNSSYIEIPAIIQQKIYNSEEVEYK